MGLIHVNDKIEGEIEAWDFSQNLMGVNQIQEGPTPNIGDEHNLESSPSNRELWLGLENVSKDIGPEEENSNYTKDYIGELEGNVVSLNGLRDLNSISDKFEANSQ